MININAKDRGRTAFNNGKRRHPMNDAPFVELMYVTVNDNTDDIRAAKAFYISEWKSGWDEAKTETKIPAKPAKKKAKKKARKKKAKK